jgi:uncharacterized protein (DUF1501 family)
MSMVDRRQALKLGASLTLLAPFTSLSYAARDSGARFVLVILRGGLDGLAAVPPYGDARYRSLRGELALDIPGPGSTLDLDGYFGLHPSLATMHELYRSGELAVLHAVATPYRERSHFDGQKVLETGGTKPETSAGGWLNRALSSMLTTGSEPGAVALASNVPLVLRGAHAVTSWAPSRLPGSSDDTIARIRSIYEAVDPLLAERLIEALNAREIAGDAAMDGRARQQALGPIATAAGRFLKAPDGPRIAVIEAGGWDTHANQGGAQGPLANRLGALDRGLQSLRDELGDAWSTTTIMIVTEFGRTVAVNGTRGTDHGTAGCALIAGGRVTGGRVISDWPGLAATALYEGRDLRATLDLRAAFKGVLGHQFAVTEAALATTVFPTSTRVPPLEDLFRA